MKKFILAVLLVAGGAGTALAQTSQGNIVLAGNIGVASSQTESTNYNDLNVYISKHRETAINFNPSVGYFISDGFEAGVGAFLYYSSNKDDTNTSGATHRYKTYEGNLSPYLRKYFPLTEKLMFHGTGYIAAGIGRNISGEDENKSTNRTTSLGMGAYPGLTYFVTEKFGINTTFGTLNYTRKYNKPEARPKSVNNEFRVDLSLSTVRFGLSYFIAR